MGFARMTVLSAVAAVVGVGGIYASASPAADQGRRVIIEREGDGPGGKEEEEGTEAEQE